MGHYPAMDFQDAVRARIRQRMEELGLPLTGKMYTDAGIGGTTVRNFLEGMTSSFTVATAEKLAPLLKVSSQWLLFGEAAEIVRIWERIPIDRRPMAARVLGAIEEDVSGTGREQDGARG